jgi:hypothetical protein
MNPLLPDPHHSAPEVSPEDGWEDTTRPTAESSPPANVLPPRRTAADASTSSADSASSGLRIDSHLLRTQPAESAQRLEVQELKSTVVRLDQMAPTPTKVARQVTFHERTLHEKDQSSSSGENAAWGATRQLPKLWMIGAGAGILAIVILVMALLPVINSRNGKNSSIRGTATKPIVEGKAESADDLELMMTKQAEAMQVFRAYLTATRVEDVIPLIRNGKALEETLRSHWRPTGIPSRWEPSSDCTWTIKKIADHACGFLRGSLPDQSPFLAYFTNDGDQLQLDWKATSAFCTATFQELEKSAGDPTEIRGEIILAPFYTSTWPETEYQSFRLTSPDGQDIIWCYSRRKDPPHLALAPFFRRDLILAQPTDSWKITLRLTRGPEGALPNQWLIGEMLHIDWLAP